MVAMKIGYLEDKPEDSADFHSENTLRGDDDKILREVVEKNFRWHGIDTQKAWRAIREHLTWCPVCWALDYTLTQLVSKCNDIACLFITRESQLENIEACAAALRRAKTALNEYAELGVPLSHLEDAESWLELLSTPVIFNSLSLNDRVWVKKMHKITVELINNYPPDWMDRFDQDDR